LSKCGSKEFEDSILKGTGKVVTYTIMTVPPAGFEDLSICLGCDGIR